MPKVAPKAQGYNEGDPTLDKQDCNLQSYLPAQKKETFFLVINNQPLLRVNVSANVRVPH